MKTKLNLKGQETIEQPIVKIVPKGVKKTEPFVVSIDDFKFENLARLSNLSFENGQEIPFAPSQTSIYDIVEYAKEHNQLKTNFSIEVENIYSRKNELKPLFSTSHIIHFKFENDFLAVEKVDFVKPITMYVNYKYHNYKELDDIIENFLVERSKYNKVICDYNKENNDAFETLFYMLF